MPHFAYTARDRNGQAVADELEAPSRKDALRRLRARGLQPLKLNERSGPARKKATKPKAKPATAAQSPSSPVVANKRRGKVKFTRNHRLPFLQSLYDLTSSGLSAGEAIRLLSQRLKDPALQGLNEAIWERLSEGANLSKALQDFPEVFDESTISLLQAGEATGNLNETLERLIQHLTEQREMRSQLINAMLYPTFMSVVALGVILMFLFFLLPKLMALLAAVGGDLPFITQVLVDSSNFALRYGLFVVAAVVVLGTSFWRWRATESGRWVTDQWSLRLPLLREFVQAQTVLAFSQTLAVLLENGITTAEALRMTEKQIANRPHRAAFNEASDRIMEGESLSQTLPDTGCFPDLVLDQLAVGENTGNVVPSLHKIATAYRKEVSRQLNLFTKVFASGVLVSVFAFVGFIAVAMVTAISTLGSSFAM